MSIRSFAPLSEEDGETGRTNRHAVKRKGETAAAYNGSGQYEENGEQLGARPPIKHSSTRACARPWHMNNSSKVNSPPEPAASQSTAGHFA